MTTVIGYARVSTHDQTPQAQEEALRGAGCSRVFVDVGESSRTLSRPQWAACSNYLRAGDTLVVWRLDRLAGTTSMMIELITELGERGVNVRSLTEPVIDTTTPMGTALFGIVAVFAQLRVDTIRENTRAGLAAARAQGRVGGRPTVMTREKVAAARALQGDGMSHAKIATVLEVSPSAVGRALRRK